MLFLKQQREAGKTACFLNRRRHGKLFDSMAQFL